MSTAAPVYDGQPVHPDIQSAYDGQLVHPDLVAQDGSMTLGVGMLCDNRTSVIVTIDKRTIAPMRGDPDSSWTIDDTNKSFRLPHDIYLVGAGPSSNVHRFRDLLRDRLRKFTPKRSIIFETVDRAIVDVRKHLWELAQDQDYSDIRNELLETAIIVGGYLQDEAFLWRFDRLYSLETNLSPGHYVIGTCAVSSNDFLWTERQQTEKMSVQRSIFHAYDAINRTRDRNEQTQRYIGPSGDFTVLGKRKFTIPADCPLLPEWAETFEKDSAPLDGAEYRAELMKFAMPLPAVPQSSKHDL